MSLTLGASGESHGSARTRGRCSCCRRDATRPHLCRGMLRKEGTRRALAAFGRLAHELERAQAARVGPFSRYSTLAVLPVALRSTAVCTRSGARKYTHALTGNEMRAHV
eukprot:6199006-Pleurochrysis_carterae.AAC.1